jgi:HSP20 family protein
MALIRRTEDAQVLAPNRVRSPFQIIDELMRWDPLSDLTSSFSPAFDVRETKDGYVFSADLPGMSEDALDISLDGNTLTVAGSREEEHREESERVHMYERRYGSFSRSFALPEGVDSDKIEARLEHGVLKLTVPKKPEHKPRRISLSKLFRSENKESEAA